MNARQLAGAFADDLCYCDSDAGTKCYPHKELAGLDAEMRAGTTIEHQLEALRADLEEEEALRNRLSDLLTRTAAALKGPPPPDVLHDWSDLPSVAAELRSTLEECWPLVLDAACKANARDDAAFRVAEHSLVARVGRLTGKLPGPKGG